MDGRIAHMRPSGAHRWVACAGYPALAAGIPASEGDSDNDIREDGTACHWLAAEVWEGRTPKIGSLSPNGRIITDEMYDAVDLYHDQLRSPSCEGMQWWIEQPVDCGSTIWPGVWGTPDAAGYRPGVLRIVDLKYGFRFVEVWFNEQLVLYAVAKARELALPLDTLVELIIVQPRSNHRDGPVRTWTTRLSTLLELADKLRKAAAEAMAPAPRCTPGPHCYECPAAFRCVALQDASYAAIEKAYSAIPLVLSPEALGTELAHLDSALCELEARVAGLKEQAAQLVRSGKTVRGWSLQPTFSREAWQPGQEQNVIALGNLMGANLSKPSKAITPNQARKLLPPGTVEAFSHRPSTGVTLKRIDPLEAMKKFSNQPNVE